jgi:hypothetical protein
MYNITIADFDKLLNEWNELQYLRLQYLREKRESEISERKFNEYNNGLKKFNNNFKK